MTLDLKAADKALLGLRAFPAAVTTIHDGRTNGLMSLSVASCSIIYEAPRVSVGITQYNFTHDLILNSGVFVAHFLGNGDLLEKSLEILMTLGGSSGRDGEKLTNLSTKSGVTGAPILDDALAYVEGRVFASVDTQESTFFYPDVVNAEIQHTNAARLNIAEAWSKLPKEWVETYEANHLAQTNSARRNRGLPEQDH